MPTTSLTNWDFHNFHVQQELKGGQFISAESTLVAAGPPELPGGDTGAGITTDTAGLVYPIGVLESVGLQQNRQLQRIFEIGSSRSYFIPGRTIGSVSIGRTFYFGPSLLRVLYAYYNQTGTGITFGDTGAPGATTNVNGDVIMDPKAPLLQAALTDTLHTVKKTPGDGHFWIDLASDVFAQPTGMAMYFKDANDTTLGAFYLEDCYVQGHQMNVSSGSVLVMEGASLQYDQLVPIQLAL